MNNFINNFTQVPKATGVIIRERSYLTLLLVVWVILFGFMFYLPVNVVPSNSAGFQAAIFGFKDYLFLGTTSLLSALILAMQVKIFRQGRLAKMMAGHTALGGAGLLSGMVSSVFGTATCSLCVGALFGFLGANAVLFLVNNKTYVVLGSLGLLLLSLYFSSKKLNHSCEACGIN